MSTKLWGECTNLILTCSTNYNRWQCQRNDFIIIFQYFEQIAWNKLFLKMLHLWLSSLFHLSSLIIYFKLHSLIIVSYTFKFGCARVRVTSFSLNNSNCGFFWWLWLTVASLDDSEWFWLVLGCVKVDVTFLHRFVGADVD